MSDDPVRVSVLVEADVRATFRRFTEETDTWWKRGARYRIAGANPGSLHLEPFLHGRLFESFDRGGVRKVVRIGRLHTWDPPHLIAFEWRAPQCAANELTDVEVAFEPRGADTLVTVTHRGWSALAPDHPARRELGSPREFWTELLRGLVELAPQTD
jgi:uncharacterized protein YndB with AHSA1/START domain